MANAEKLVLSASIMAIDEINQQGGVQGRQVQAVVEDGRSDPETFA
jgi:urea transport system substrate-binding protein